MSSRCPSATVPSWTHLFRRQEGKGPPTGRWSCATEAFHRGPQGFVYDTTQAEEISCPGVRRGSSGGPRIKDLPAFEATLRRLAANVEAPIKEASLVLPDTWMRLTFTEISDLPRRPAEIQEVLRWKLKRLVPFRVEDLRVAASEVTPFPNQEEPRRLLLGFGLESLLAQLESAFEAVGISVGRVTNTTLAILASLEHQSRPAELSALVTVLPGAFTISYMLNGEPLLYRYKTLSSGSSQTTVRDLRLTAHFISQHFPEIPLARLFLAALPGDEDPWLGWLREGFDAEPEPLAFEHFLPEPHPGRSGLGSTRRHFSARRPSRCDVRVVNLAKKPFVNRRPVIRTAGALWVIGLILLGTNLALYSSHWRGTADNRTRLSEAEQALREEERESRGARSAADQPRSQVEKSRVQVSERFDRSEDVSLERSLRPSRKGHPGRCPPGNRPARGPVGGGRAELEKPPYESAARLPQARRNRLGRYRLFRGRRRTTGRGRAQAQRMVQDGRSVNPADRHPVSGSVVSECPAAQ